MPKFVCQCGDVIQLGQIPSPNEWLLINDVTIDNFSGMVDSEKIYAKSIRMVKCPACSRLFVFWNGYESDPQIFMPDESPS